jgi:hypothetical protein
MQEPSYLGKITLVWFRMVLTQIITWVYKDSLTLPTNYQYLTGVIILIPTGRVFDTIIVVDY